jgi:hypothetical protein
MASPLSLDDTVLGNPAQMPSTGGLARLGKFNTKQLPAADHADDAPVIGLRPASPTAAGVVKALSPTPDSVLPGLVKAALPTQVASMANLRQDGSVYKGKDASGATEYSGTNIAAGAPLLDAVGRPLGTLRDSGLGTPAASTAPIAPVSPQAPLVSGGDGSGLASFGDDFVARRDERNAMAGLSSIDPKTRAAAAVQVQMLNDNRKNAIARQGIEAGLRGHMYGADRQLEGTKATADAHLMGSMASLRMQQMGRMALAQAMQQTGGNARAAAKLLTSWGYPADGAISMANADQGWEGKAQSMQVQAAKSADERVKAFAVPDEKGNISPASLAKVRAQVENMKPGYFQGDEPSQSAAWPEIEAKLHLLKVIHVQSEADLDKLDAENFGKGVENLGKPSGFVFVDAWKSAITPALASVAMFLLLKHFHTIGWKLDDKGWELCGAVLGVFVAGATTDNLDAQKLVAVAVNVSVTGTPSIAVVTVRDDAVLAGLTAADTYSLMTMLDAAVSQTVLAKGEPPIWDDAGETHVVNYATNATSVYTGLQFNSYFALGGKQFGVTRDGLFELSGDTDDGSPIQATINFGQTDAGTSLVKLASECYIAAGSAGELYLRVTANDTQYLYRARTSSPGMQLHRVDLGKGLRANFFKLELLNTDGDDFALDHLEFRAMPTNRRF